MKHLFISLFLLIAIETYAQNCDLITKHGIYDTRTLSISRERAISYLNLFKRDTRMTLEEAKSYSATIGIPIETVMINLGFSSSEYGYSQFLESISNMTTYDEIFIEKIVSVSRLINKDILSVLDKCYQQAGIHSRIETSEDPMLAFLVLKFSWDGSHSPLPVDVIINDIRGVSMDGERLTGNRKLFTMHPDEEIRVPISSTSNKTIGFSVRVRRQVSGGTVIVRSGNLAMYGQKPVPTNPTREFKVQRIPTRDLRRTVVARYSGGNDEELKRFETTELDGSFNLGISGNKLTGNFHATITEVVPDNTQFTISDNVEIYTAPEGWRIAGYGIENEAYGTSFTKLGPIRQTNWASPQLHTNGPIQYYVWQGDSGENQDAIHGCWIQARLKDIVVLLEKM